MTTLFDYVTVGCFLAMAGAYFNLTSRQPRLLVHLLLAGIVFAFANQVGNAGYDLLAWILIVAGAGYAVLTVRQG